ncbi:MAG TPA: aldehyde dehydrogenase [Pseudogracilibacillus sp.]|nr:aldehyde dehydrogenase [Pseudogracilibacillus sp.]
MEKIVERQRQFFYSNETKSYSFRKRQLQTLHQMMKKHERAFLRALRNDLQKSEHEAFTTELGIIHQELRYVMNNLSKWMKRTNVSAPFTHQGTKNYIHYEPYGVTLIIAPWNYPVQLAIVPVIGALAAGNTVILKPSEFAPTVASLLERLVKKYFSEDVFTVVNGDRTVSERLLNERFDKIFFTGSSDVGKIVMERASKHLTPVTLELGGKSPAIVDKTAHLTLSAKRIAWGKFTNAGQTCVAPDYLYVHEDIYRSFVKRLTEQIITLYSKAPLQNKSYTRIINEDHFQRLTSFIHDKNILFGGKSDTSTLRIEPTLITDVNWEDDVMQNEIFGPILPILRFNDIDDVIYTLQRKEKPLALYYFGAKDETKEKIINHLSFGGGAINDTLYHLANYHLPFGGVGQSGFGNYHGKHSFETFSHKKSIMEQTTKFDLPIRYPGSKIRTFLAKKILKK